MEATTSRQARASRSDRDDSKATGFMPDDKARARVHQAPVGGRRRAGHAGVAVARSCGRGRAPAPAAAFASEQDAVLQLLASRQTPTSTHYLYMGGRKHRASTRGTTSRRCCATSGAATHSCCVRARRPDHASRPGTSSISPATRSRSRYTTCNENVSEHGTWEMTSMHFNIPAGRRRARLRAGARAHAERAAAAVRQAHALRRCARR